MTEFPARVRNEVEEDSARSVLRVSVDAGQPLASEQQTGHDPPGARRSKPTPRSSPARRFMFLRPGAGPHGQLRGKHSRRRTSAGLWSKSSAARGRFMWRGRPRWSCFEVEILDYDWGDSGVHPLIPGFGFLLPIIFPESRSSREVGVGQGRCEITRDPGRLPSPPRPSPGCSVSHLPSSSCGSNWTSERVAGGTRLPCG